MKSIFVLHHVLVGVGYPCAFAAEAAGLVPPSLMSLPVLAGYYVAAGVVALACDDYRDEPRDPRPRRRARYEVPARPAAAEPMPTWASRTMSA